MIESVYRLSGDEAVKFWQQLFGDCILPFGAEIRRHAEKGVAVVVCPDSTLNPGDMGWDGHSPVFRADDTLRRRVAQRLLGEGDKVSYAWLTREDRRVGRVFVFAGTGSFLMNLDLKADPSKISAYSLEPKSLDAEQESSYLGHRKGVLDQEWSEVNRQIAVLITQAAQREADVLEGYMSEHSGEVPFGELLKTWVKGAVGRNVLRWDKKNWSDSLSKESTDQFTDDLEAELIRRGLDRWIVDGPSIRATASTPVRALAALVGGHVFNRLDTRVGLPSGRWITPDEVRAAAREMILPPLLTPNNIEVAMMSLARFAAFTEAGDTAGVNAFWQHSEDRQAFREDTRVQGLLSMIGFGITWRENGFARLELGHKLAAALMFTDCKDTVQAPWGAWSLILPDGLLGEVEIRRIWCVGDRPAVLLIKVGDQTGPLELALFNGDDPEDQAVRMFAYSQNNDDPKLKAAIEAQGPEYLSKLVFALPLVQNLVRGVCLALSNPSEWRKPDYYGKPSGSDIKKPSQHKELPVGERYVLGQPVKIDLREEVLEHVRTGRVGGSSPTKLFLVRGHWRRQAHGPKMLFLRKTIWVEPFWKGPEDARVLLRTYQT